MSKSSRRLRNRGRSGGVGGGASGGAGGMMSRLQKMQEEIKKAQEELETETIDVTAGGGAITITITGHQRVQSVKLDPDVVDPDDVDMLEDLLVAAVNQAIEESQKMAADRLEPITGGMDIPGL
ncbi:MAG: YbaB/EbfC family nucleoid-associated protein [Chloroflexi bacterium]|nr:YbaB/EbfC family nucleoid-associated protein [Chloroflexota bacterium]